MSRNVKLGNTTLSGVDAIKLNDADSVGTYDLFYCDDLFETKAVSAKATQQIISPSGSNVALDSVTIYGVSTSNMTAGNIKAGVTMKVESDVTNIKSVTGTYTSDATATAGDIVSGKSAYVNGSKINGSMTIYDGSVT